MDHIAIMKKSWGLIPKIISKQKIIESRWYQTKRAPWDKINVGDIVYFKNSGEKITARATAFKILQFQIKNISDIKEITEEYGERIGLKDINFNKLPRYCVLVFIKNAEYLKKPFSIDKTGFGTGNAWLIINSINKIKIRDKN